MSDDPPLRYADGPTAEASIDIAAPPDVVRALASDIQLPAQWMRMGPAPSGISPAIEAMPDKESKILRRRLGELRANMERTLQGIRELAGGTPAATAGWGA